MTLEEAKEIAIRKNSKVNRCLEYEKGYRFYDDNFEGEGDAGVVIVKGTGKAVSWIDFLLSYHPETNPKEREI